MPPHAGLRETWEDGRAFKELAQRRAAVADAKEGIEAARKVALPNPFQLQARVEGSLLTHCWVTGVTSRHSLLSEGQLPPCRDPWETSSASGLR